jgi:transcriptional regulator with XRE-family HTH domain
MIPAVAHIPWASLSETEINRIIGKRIKARRRLLEMSQVTLAHGLGVTFQQIQKYESGSRLSVVKLMKIAELLETDVVHFCTPAPAQLTLVQQSVAA